MDNNKYLISIIIILAIIIAYRLSIEKRNVDKFSSGILTQSKEQMKINGIINEVLKDKIKSIKLVNSTIDEDKLEESEKAINLLDDELPLGMISFFYDDPNKDNEGKDLWVQCNGTTITFADYPDFFRYLNKGKSASNKVFDFQVPNIVGRTIVGAGYVSKSGDINNTTNFHTDSKTAFFTWKSENIRVNERGGFDYCPTKDIKKAQRAGYSGNRVCTNMNNMPPHIYLTPYMKVKNRKFKLIWEK